MGSRMLDLQEVLDLIESSDKIARRRPGEIVDGDVQINHCA